MEIPQSDQGQGAPSRADDLGCRDRSCRLYVRTDRSDPRTRARPLGVRGRHRSVEHLRGALRTRTAAVASRARVGLGIRWGSVTGRPQADPCAGGSPIVFPHVARFHRLARHHHPRRAPANGGCCRSLDLVVVMSRRNGAAAPQSATASGYGSPVHPPGPASARWAELEQLRANGQYSSETEYAAKRAEILGDV